MKPVVFLSHISEESDLATIVKDQIANDFLGMIDVFQSSSPKSIQPGQRWLERIDQNLQQAEVVILLCSEKSVARPWLNFEAGAGWIKNVPVIPICHSGMRPSRLPLPLNLLNGIMASELGGWNHLYGVLASRLGSATPTLKQNGFLEDVSRFEREYSLLSDIRGAVQTIGSVDRVFGVFFSPSNRIRTLKGSMFENLKNALEPSLALMQQRGMISYSFSYTGMAVSETGGGNTYDFEVHLSDFYASIVEEVASSPEEL